LFPRAPTESGRTHTSGATFDASDLDHPCSPISFDPDAFTGGSASFANPTTSARAARAAGLGVNWYLNQNFKWQIDYELTRYDGGATNGDRPDERAALTRFSLVF
jgi:phosphate-selective porin OprO and OprP